MKTSQDRPISEIVKDPEWQKIRKDLVGKWKSDPEYCCSQLRKYLGDPKKASLDKLRILKNYLYSSGFRIGIIKHKCIDQLRAIVLSELKKRKFEKE